MEQSKGDQNDQKSENGDDNDENQEDVLSIDDIVEINENLEREAEALLGGQNDNVCTYPEGYKYRQPLYSCRTCAAENEGQYAGICYACSGNCHEGHDLIELYTKRKFSCDCGNSKFKSKCRLYEEKCSTNILNKYNDNFAQIYCMCKKVYPPSADEETVDAGDMHQCCVCEDWFHLSHIFEEPALSEILEKLQSEDEDENWELACKSCVSKLSFLMLYDTRLSKEKLVSSNETISDCKLAEFTEAYRKSLIPHSIYFKPTWRDELCKCVKCLDMYNDEECAFLIDPEDTFAYYDAERRRNMELQGEEPMPSDAGSTGEKKLGAGMENIIYNIVVQKTNNRDAALNAYMGVKQMYSHLGEFLSKRGEGKVITRSDIEQCFEELQAKRPRLSTPAEDAAWTQ